MRDECACNTKARAGVEVFLGKRLCQGDDKVAEVSRV